MKSFYSILLFLCSAVIFGQCPNSTIVLSSQADVDAFTTNYPGCTSLLDGLTINGFDITDLSPLVGITNISGDFIIDDADSLQDLSGLLGLTTIGGDFIINSNTMLDLLDGLDNLVSIGGDFEITSGTISSASGLGALTTISGNFRPLGLSSFIGLSALQTVGGDFNVQNRSLPTSFTGLSALTTIGGDFRGNNSEIVSFSGFTSINSIGGSISLLNTFDLLSFSGMETLTTIGGNLIVNNTMTSLNGLNGLTTIQGDFSVGSSSQIVNLNGMNSITTIGGDFTVSNSDMQDISSTSLQTVSGEINITQNASLTSMSLSGLVTAGQDILIDNNDALSTISGFNSLTSANGSVTISGNNALTSLSPFTNLTSITQDLVFTGNGLTAISGFPGLQTIGGTLQITSSGSLTALSGFTAANSIGALQVQSNANLASIQGFDSLTSVVNDFTIKQNGALLAITNFNALSTTGGTIFIEINGNLTQINTFGSLTTTGGLVITSNSSLQSISGLSGLTTVNGDLDISNNTSLTSVNNFPNVTTLSGNLVFSTQSLMTEYEGFELLDTIGGNMYFQINANLNNLPNFNSLTAINGTVLLDRNDSFTNLNNLSQLVTIGGSLRLEDNPLLSDIEGLNNVTSIGDDLSIEESVITTGFDSLLTIGGDFRFDDNDNVNTFDGFDLLQSIGGFFSITNHGHDFEYFLGAPNLTSIGDSVNIVGNLGLIEITAINAVTTLGNHINFFSNGDLERLEMDNLVTVPGYIEYGGVFTSMEHFSLASLTSVGQHIDIENIGVYLNLQNLSTVGDYLKFEDFNGNNTESVDLGGRRIIKKGGDVTIEGTINTLSGWNNLTSIGGNLRLDFNYNIVDLNGLQGITNVPGDLYLRGDYSEYTGLDNLVSVDGNASFIPVRFGNSTGVPIVDFTGLGQLATIGGDMLIAGFLQSYEGISSLTSVGGNLVIDNSDFVTDLQGLESLVSISGELEIRNNNVLTTLIGLDNIDYNTITELTIANNPDLSFCSILPICGYLEVSTNTNIFNNATGCDDETQIQDQCNFNTINGNVLYDFNIDGCDSGDYAAGSVLVNVTDGTIDYSTLTDENGDYTLFVGEGTFTVSVVPESLPQDFDSDPVNETITFVGFDQVETANFCLTATQVFDDLRIALFPLEAARPGFDVSYRLIYENFGTTVQSGSVTLQFDTARMSFLAADPMEASISGNVITWNYTDLVPFQSDQIEISFNVLPPPTNQSDDILEFEATVNPVADDITPLDNTITFEHIVVNSFDPNDKQVVQGEEIFIEQVGEYLDYIVRFQNTGTADAINVRIADQLSANLDFNTLRVLSSSHSYRTEINNGMNVEFIFEDINLPPETVDPEGSMGFIAFQVRTNTDLQIGDIVENTASIFFDFNPPIITNTVVTEVVEELGVENSFYANTVYVVPNPVNDALNIVSDKAVETVRVYSIFGRLLFETNGDEVNFTNRASGIYFVEITTSVGTSIRKVIKE